MFTRILVTGGTGFISSNLAGRLLRDGHEVTALDNLLSGHRSKVESLPGSCFVEGDVRDSLADIDEARRALGFAPSVGLVEGLAEYVAWAQEEVVST